MTIPKTIHYCWFGRGAKPKKIMMCMRSWQKHLSDFQLVEWNEDNFDIESNEYVKQAYEAKKYAFVSDYVRLFALYRHGGIYMDTDVEVIQPLDRFLIHEAFSGFEDETYLQSGTMGAAKGHPWIKELLDDYQERCFVLPDGSYDMTTNTSVITKSCVQQGLVQNGTFQALDNGVVFYPREFFSPYDYINGGNYITNESYTIHHFAKSWLPAHVRLRSVVKRGISRLAGPKTVSTLRDLLWKSR